MNLTSTFEWDEAKNLINQQKHGLSFELAVQMFKESKMVIQRSSLSGNDDERWLATGLIGGKLATAVFTYRRKSLRIISLRSTRNAEKREYRKIYHG
ncbi:MAG: BrnT family toxin [Alphaproteobacteria bacterium]|nr:BrnT family toxin [Alphaproteobacteria bacterium]